MEYMLCGRSSATSLAYAVQEHINDGWSLQGGVAIVSIRDEVWYYQAMIKIIDDSDAKGCSRIDRIG